MRCAFLIAILLSLTIPEASRADGTGEVLAQAEEMATAFLTPRGLSRDSFQAPQVTEQMGMISVVWLPKDFASPWYLMAHPDAKLICRPNRRAPTQTPQDCDSGYATPSRQIPRILPTE